MYLNNKYSKWYYSIINKAKLRVDNFGYMEKHHIIPRSLGGSRKNKDNIVSLTPKEHFICHLLLTKMTTGQHQYKMLKALTMLMGVKNIGKGRYVANSRWYSYIREKNKENIDIFWTEEKRKTHSDKLKIYNKNLDKNSEKEIERKRKISEAAKNKVWTKKAIITRSDNMRKSSEKRKGKPWTENRRKAYESNPPTQTKEANRKRSEALTGKKTSSGMLGKTHTSETKLKIAKNHKGKMYDSPRTVYAWLKSPDNIDILFGPLLHECKIYNLQLDYISSLCKGKKLSYKGWAFNRFATPEEKAHKIQFLREKGLMF